MRFFLTQAALGMMLCSVALTSHAGLQITPPQLAPDDNGIISTEVRSSLPTASRWSVRVVPWNPKDDKETPGAGPGPESSVQAGHQTAQALRVSALAAPSAARGVEISPRFFSLSSAGRQVIRARIADRSRHYRLLIEQIPDEVSSAGKGVNFRFRFSLPIFTSAQDPLIPPGLILQ